MGKWSATFRSCMVASILRAHEDCQREWAEQRSTAKGTLWLTGQSISQSVSLYVKPRSGLLPNFSLSNHTVSQCWGALCDDSVGLSVALFLHTYTNTYIKRWHYVLSVTHIHDLCQSRPRLTSLSFVVTTAGSFERALVWRTQSLGVCDQMWAGSCWTN